MSEPTADQSPATPPPNGVDKPRISTPLVVLFSFLLLLALPILPIYLWRKGRLSAPWGVGLAVAWFAFYVAVGSLLPEEAKDSETSAKSDVTKTATPTPKPTAFKTPSPTPTKTTTAPTPTKAPQSDPCADVAKNVLKNPAYVFKCQFGNEWPLTVPQGIVSCRDKPGTNVQILTFFDPDAKEWALNGIASGAGYPKIDPIWRDDDSGLGLKVDIGPLIERASDVCD